MDNGRRLGRLVDGWKKWMKHNNLGIQLPFEKVFNLLKTPQTTFLEGIWIPRVIFIQSILRGDKMVKLEVNSWRSKY